MNGDDWIKFTRDQALRAHGLRTFGTPPVDLQVDKACPDCGREDRWTRMQVIGESPGRTDVVCATCEHSYHKERCQTGDCRCLGGFQKIVARPAQRSGVVMMCYNCGAKFMYRDVPFSDQEQGARTSRLLHQGKIGRTPL
jgi:hypothetical protein